MRWLSAVWPGVALTITMVDDLVAGPLIAFGVVLVGPQLGIPLSMAVFTAFVAGLVGSALRASRQLDARTQERIETTVERVSRRKFIGRFVQRVGDDHLMATAIIAMVVSPVLAVLLARIVHPGQRLSRTVAVAVAAYAFAFSLFYALDGSVIGALL